MEYNQIIIIFKIILWFESSVIHLNRWIPYKTGMDWRMKSTVQENELWSKAYPDSKHDSQFIFFMEAGHGEVKDIRNLKYDRFF